MIYFLYAGKLLGLKVCPIGLARQRQVLQPDIRH